MLNNIIVRLTTNDYFFRVSTNSLPREPWLLLLSVLCLREKKNRKKKLFFIFVCFLAHKNFKINLMFLHFILPEAFV